MSKVGGKRKFLVRSELSHRNKVGKQETKTSAEVTQQTRCLKKKNALGGCGYGPVGGELTHRPWLDSQCHINHLWCYTPVILASSLTSSKVMC